MKYTNFNTAANCNQYLVYSTNVNNKNISSLYLLQLIACFKSINSISKSAFMNDQGRNSTKLSFTIYAAISQIHYM